MACMPSTATAAAAHALSQQLPLQLPATCLSRVLHLTKALVSDRAAVAPSQQLQICHLPGQGGATPSRLLLRTLGSFLAGVQLHPDAALGDQGDAGPGKQLAARRVAPQVRGDGVLTEEARQHNDRLERRQPLPHAAAVAGITETVG